jgi:hypothetical protein
MPRPLSPARKLDPFPIPRLIYLKIWISALGSLKNFGARWINNVVKGSPL